MPPENSRYWMRSQKTMSQVSDEEAGSLDSNAIPANITFMQQEIASLKKQVDELRQLLELCKLNCTPQQNYDEDMNESIWITKDGQRKLFTYRIKKMNGEFVRKYDMESEFKKKYMEPLPKNLFACKGTPNCVHPPLEKKGRSNKIYDHIRKNLRYAFVCIYCPLGKGSNFEQFSKHLKEHFDEHGVQPDDSNLDKGVESEEVIDDNSAQ